MISIESWKQFYNKEKEKNQCFFLFFFLFLPISLVDDDLSSSTRWRAWGGLDSSGESDSVVGQVEVGIIFMDESVSKDERWVSDLFGQLHSDDSDDTL